MPTARSVPSFAPIAGSSAKGSPSVEHRATRGKSFDADLGALQVTEHGNVLAHGKRGATHALDALTVVARRTVGEIHAHDVRAAADDVLEHAWRVGCRAQRGDDLGSAEHW